jgi:hypothetical protein
MRNRNDSSEDYESEKQSPANRPAPDYAQSSKSCHTSTLQLSRVRRDPYYSCKRAAERKVARDT